MSKFNRLLLGSMLNAAGWSFNITLLLLPIVIVSALLWMAAGDPANALGLIIGVMFGAYGGTLPARWKELKKARAKFVEIRDAHIAAMAELE